MQIHENYPLAELTTFKIGGAAQFIAFPESAAEVQEALLFAQQKNLDFFIIGGGSNLLISDNGYQGLIIHLKNLDTISTNGEEIYCEAGVPVAKLTKEAAAQGLSGIEFAGGLPGSTGGALFMNARAYGGSFDEVVSSITVVTKTGELQTISATDMQYGYKESRLMHSGEILISATLKLKQGDKKEILAKTEENRQKRVNGGQFLYPNAGCVFKNNYQVGIPSGKLIDESGLLGLSVGGASVFERHGNFIINKENASANDIKQLIEKIKAIVLEKKGVLLEEEVRYLGFSD